MTEHTERLVRELEQVKAERDRHYSDKRILANDCDALATAVSRLTAERDALREALLAISHDGEACYVMHTTVFAQMEAALGEQP